MLPTSQKPFLRQTTGAASTFPINENRPTTIGREASCQIVLDSTQYQGVSRRHAEIRPIPGSSVPQFEICDLGSSNGTYVNQQRIVQPHRLQPGDTIRLGNSGAQFVFESPMPVAAYGAPAQTVLEAPQAQAPYAPVQPNAYPPMTPQQSPVAASPNANRNKIIAGAIAAVVVLALVNPGRLIGRLGGGGASQPTQPVTVPDSPKPDSTSKPDSSDDSPKSDSAPTTANNITIDASELDAYLRITSKPQQRVNETVTTKSKGTFKADVLAFEVEAKTTFNPRSGWFSVRFLDANNTEIGTQSILYVEDPPAQQWDQGLSKRVFFVLPPNRSTLKTVQFVRVS